VSGALLVRSLAALAGNLTLLGSIHRSEPTIFLCHVFLLPSAVDPSTLRRDAEMNSRAGVVQRGCHAWPWIYLEVVESVRLTGRCQRAGHLGGQMPDVSTSLPRTPDRIRSFT
jgi:hypothetical protein